MPPTIDPGRMLPETQYADLEIRIFERQRNGYPVEITLNLWQNFPRGFLDPAFLPWVPSASPSDDGERLFHWLFSDDKLKTAWARAHGAPSWARRLD